MVSAPPAYVNDEELRFRALSMQCDIRHALETLQRLPVHPQRTRAGRHLLDALRIIEAWDEDGTMDTSKGVL